MKLRYKNFLLERESTKYSLYKEVDVIVRNKEMSKKYSKPIGTVVDMRKDALAYGVDFEKAMEYIIGESIEDGYKEDDEINIGLYIDLWRTLKTELKREFKL